MEVKTMTRRRYEQQYGVRPLEAQVGQVQTLEGEQTKKNALSKLGLDFLVGFGKSIPATLKGAADLGQTILEAPLKPLGLASEGRNTDIIPERVYTPTSTAQKAGKFVGDVAQFAIPGAAVTKATRGANMATRMLGEGLVGGGVSAVQSGKFDKNARDVAIMSALFPPAGKLASKAKSKLEGSTASRVINSLIKPLKKDMAYGKNPGRAVAKEGIVANSLDDLERQIGQRLDSRLLQLEKKLANTNKTFNVSNVIKPLDDVVDDAVRMNNQAAINRLQEAKIALTRNLKQTVDDTGKIGIQVGDPKNLKNLTPTEIREFKKLVGRLTKFTGNRSDDEIVNRALKQVYRKLDDVLDRAVPGIDDLNKRIADLISAKTATKYRNELLERQNLIKFTPKVLGGSGVAMSIFMGGNPIPAIIGLGAAGMEKAMGTPGFKTRFASWLAGASSAEKAELIKKAPWVKAFIQRTLSGDN